MEETKMSDVVEEIKGASEEELKKIIEEHFEAVRTQGMRIGASYISAAVFGAARKNLKKGLNSSSLRDCQRALKRILEIVSVQLDQETVQNDSNETEVVEETPND